jgi:hypothetical protein
MEAGQGAETGAGVKARGSAIRSGWQIYPGTECTGNAFNHLRVAESGERAFQVNDASCTNNVINVGQFLDNTQGGLRQPSSNPVAARGLIVLPLPSEIP